MRPRAVLLPCNAAHVLAFTSALEVRRDNPSMWARTPWRATAYLSISAWHVHTRRGREMDHAHQKSEPPTSKLHVSRCEENVWRGSMCIACQSVSFSCHQNMLFDLSKNVNSPACEVQVGTWQSSRDPDPRPLESEFGAHRHVRSERGVLGVVATGRASGATLRHAPRP